MLWTCPRPQVWDWHEAAGCHPLDGPGQPLCERGGQLPHLTEGVKTGPRGVWLKPNLDREQHLLRKGAEVPSRVSYLDRRPFLLEEKEERFVSLLFLLSQTERRCHPLDPDKSN